MRHVPGIVKMLLRRDGRIRVFHLHADVLRELEHEAPISLGINRRGNVEKNRSPDACSASDSKDERTGQFSEPIEPCQSEPQSEAKIDDIVSAAPASACKTIFGIEHEPFADQHAALNDKTSTTAAVASNHIRGRAVIAADVPPANVRSTVFDIGQIREGRAQRTPGKPTSAASCENVGGGERDEQAARSKNKCAEVSHEASNPVG